MPELNFRPVDAKVVERAASPVIALTVEIVNSAAIGTVHSVLLRTQVLIEAARRRYEPEEQKGLKELFGDTAEWGRTLKPVLWTNATNVVGAFDQSILVEVMLPCTIDLHGAASYFRAIEAGSVPLTLLFSGTVFSQMEGRPLQATPISWNTEARFRFPVALWEECLDRHYANTVCLPIRRDLFERLREIKARQGLSDLDEVIQQIVADIPEVAA
jgi:hypothetical protein